MELLLKNFLSFSFVTLPFSFPLRNMLTSWVFILHNLNLISYLIFSILQNEENIFKLLNHLLYSYFSLYFFLYNSPFIIGLLFNTVTPLEFTACLSFKEFRSFTIDFLVPILFIILIPFEIFYVLCFQYNIHTNPSSSFIFRFFLLFCIKFLQWFNHSQS